MHMRISHASNLQLDFNNFHMQQYNVQFFMTKLDGHQSLGKSLVVLNFAIELDTLWESLP